ncbi:MAG: hypothetical protein A3H98_03660 [Bacteroidetes bacterium RIFCSPLOWO2_02_FULL_36_8]|nr:MAG: hypothetical protein A3H98_03660 [Bacteroidetes bacterium RIFCSPLOWO2_02_FULL_36_8]OFY69538.1 MAG: hypothetical protein A3G23_10905 [Bacteroidetes bacterium RIFCSPLOWO2_12_FULL_37_12]
MYNWSVDEKLFKKEDPEGYKIWRIEQLINYGLDGEKLDEKIVKKYWKKFYLDPIYSNYLYFLLWGKKRKTTS